VRIIEARQRRLEIKRGDLLIIEKGGDELLGVLVGKHTGASYCRVILNIAPAPETPLE
jgi:hypothetical protein